MTLKHFVLLTFIQRVDTLEEPQHSNLKWQIPLSWKVIEKINQDASVIDFLSDNGMLTNF